MKYCQLILIVFLCFSSCKKKKDIEPLVEKGPDTIKPGNYFPVWPGSWWKYMVGGHSLPVVDCTSVSWHLHQYPNTNYSPGRKLTDPAIVPFLNNEPIYGYKRLIYLQQPHGDYYIATNIISELMGQNYSDGPFCDSRNGNPCLTETRQLVAKALNSKQDSILIVKGRFYYSNPNWYSEANPNHQITYREYKKNVGLTFHYVYDTIKKDTTYIKRLVDFKIGSH